MHHRFASFLAILAVVVSHCSVHAAPSEHRRRQLGLDGLTGKLGVNQTFDYIIIGGGTAGLVVANRLSEDPAVQVAVIEAGSYYEITNPIIGSTPAGDVIGCGSSPLSTTPLADWNFITNPQAGAANRAIHYARGRCLGGSSARNFMIYQRGTVQSYQKRADQVGDQSYTFSNFLPYFKKGISFTPPNTAKRAPNASAGYDSEAFSPAGGPLKVSYANYAQTFSGYMKGAFSQIGIAPKPEGFNSGSLFGAEYCASTINPENEFRASSEESYLRAAKGRSNLKVFSPAMAKRILFDSNKRATGVLVDAASVLPFILSANKEVIVSAGAFQSPQMLMVSGIGPASTLKQNGIDVLVDNPNVGQNMWDHVFAGPTYRVNLETFTKLANDPVYVGAQFIGPYLTKGEGPLTNPVADLLGWEKVPASLRNSFTPSAQQALANTFPSDWPEIEYISGAGYVGDFADLLTTQPKDGYMYATILSTLVAPLSRGNVTIKSADTNILPIINPNWLTDPTDQQVAVAAFKRARQAFAAPFLQKVVIGEEYFPGKTVQTDAEILENYKKTLLTVWHASCTCAMGQSPSKGAVIDSHARVFGVSGVRVVDASSFPILPPGHPQSTIYALAEKISDLIKKGQ